MARRRRRKGKSDIDCPRCGIPLRWIKVHHLGPDVIIDVCKRCGGSWYDSDELIVHIHDEHMRRRLTSFPEIGEESPIACPRCGSLMRLRHEGDVEVDVCTECQGVWLDLGEREALQYTIEWDEHEEQEQLAERRSAIHALLDGHTG